MLLTVVGVHFSFILFFSSLFFLFFIIIIIIIIIIHSSLPTPLWTTYKFPFYSDIMLQANLIILMCVPPDKERPTKKIQMPGVLINTNQILAGKLILAKGGKSESPKKILQSQIEINQSQPTYEPRIKPGLQCLKKICLPCLIIIQSWYFGYTINKNYHIFSLRDLHFLLCSIDLDVLRAQRIIAFYSAQA